MKLLAIVVALGLSVAVESFSVDNFVKGSMDNKWAVLVAGSSGYYNYRHQADISHAYQILKKHGLKEDKIITFMYNDVANAEENPYKGQLFNNYAHVDVYKGVKIDYEGDDVTSDIFLKAMRGDAQLKAKGKKVLESTSADKIFFYFADHGAPDLIAFPDPNGGVLTKVQLKTLIEEMSQKQRFKEFVIYIEACESGSMFSGYQLPPNVYATTAANAEESSWGCFCDDEKMETCLGDLYSVNWMNDSDTHDLNTRTLEEQYKAVKLATDKSHVQQFGDMKISAEDLGEFQGDVKQASNEKVYAFEATDKYDSREAHLVPHMKKLRSNDAHVRKEGQLALDLDQLHKKHIENLFNWILERSLTAIPEEEKAAFHLRSAAYPATEDFDECYRNLIRAYGRCYSRLQQFSYNMINLFKFANLCAARNEINMKTEEIVKIIETACQH